MEVGAATCQHHDTRWSPPPAHDALHILYHGGHKRCRAKEVLHPPSKESSPPHVKSYFNVEGFIRSSREMTEFDHYGRRSTVRNDGGAACTMDSAGHLLTR